MLPVDPYRDLASKIFGLPYDQVTAQQRHDAKVAYYMYNPENPKLRTSE